MRGPQEAMPDRAVRSHFADDPELHELLETFVNSISEKGQRLRELFETGEFRELTATTHQLKGSAGGYGFRDCSRLAAELEAACQGMDVEQIGRALSNLLNHMGRIAM